MRLIVVGAGRHGAVVIEAARAMGGFTLIGAVDPAPSGPDVLGVPVLGGDEMLPHLLGREGEAAAFALGSNRVRQRLGAQLLQWGYMLLSIIHPSASVSP